MKINYKNPKTGKPSTINLPDHWLALYLKVMEGSWQDEEDLPDHKKTAITHMVAWCTDRYFDPVLLPEGSHLLDPKQCTLTAFIESYMASMVGARLGMYPVPVGFNPDNSRAPGLVPSPKISAAEEQPSLDLE